MTNEDMIRMAREAGFADMQGTVHAAYQLEQFAALIAAEEREACAKLCIEMASWHGDLVTAAYDSAADAIRARGQGWVKTYSGGKPNYTQPIEKDWIGLSGEELEFYTEELGQGELGRGVLRAVVDFLKEKNT